MEAFGLKVTRDWRSIVVDGEPLRCRCCEIKDEKHGFLLYYSRPRGWTLLQGPYAARLSHRQAVRLLVSERSILTHLEKNERGNWRLVALNGFVLLADESFQVCSNVQDQLERGEPDTFDETGEIAENLLAVFAGWRQKPEGRR